MKIYLAGINKMKIKFLSGELKAEEIFALESFYSIQEWQISFLSKFKSFLLDSGAFTFISNSQKKDINWDKYIEEYAAFINRWNIKLFFELDIDSIVGLREVERLRMKLEKLTGKKPIPVWHRNRGKEYFIEMCENYPYVALGGIVTKEIERKQYEGAFPWFIKTAHEHGCKIHGLGYTNLANLKKYHFDSVDSTTWTAGSRYGQVMEFKNDTIIKHNSVVKGVKIRSIREVNMCDVHNFNEWVKFSKWANAHL